MARTINGVVTPVGQLVMPHAAHGTIRSVVSSDLGVCCFDATTVQTLPLDPIATYGDVTANGLLVASVRQNQQAAFAYFWCFFTNINATPAITSDGPGIRVFGRMQKSRTRWSSDTQPPKASDLSLTGSNTTDMFSPNQMWLPLADNGGNYAMNFQREAVLQRATNSPDSVGNIYVYPPLIVPLLGTEEFMPTVWKAATVAAGTTKCFVAVQLVSGSGN